MGLPTHGWELRTTITSEHQWELSLERAAVRVPERGQVVIGVQAAPVNPSDIGLLIGPADISKAQVGGTSEQPRLIAPLRSGALQRFAGVVGTSMRVGIEGAGVVVAAGRGAEHLLGQTVAARTRRMYAQYVTVAAGDCLLMPADVTAPEAASSFVNPLTVLGMIETMRAEGHSALVHTAAASNLGQMLLKVCASDGVPLVNIVRRPEQVALLRDLGGLHICDSSQPDFPVRLVEALRETGATMAFDAVGGGGGASDILSSMETALRPAEGWQDPYAPSRHKQVYLYGNLDPNPTQIARSFGMAWGFGGWLLGPFLDQVGPEVAARLKARVVAELRTTFASKYSSVIGLRDLLRPELLVAANRRATGEKYLVRPEAN